MSVLWLSVPHLVPFRVFLLSLLLLPETWAEPLPPCGRHRGKKPLALHQLRSLPPWPKTHLSQVMSPTSLTTSTNQRLLKSSSRSIQRYGALLLVWRGTRRRDHRQSALFTTVHSGGRRTSGPKTSLFEESLLPAQSFPVCLASTGRLVHELSSPSSRSREKPSRDSENERIRILLERQKRTNSRWCRAEIQIHEFQADYDRRSIQKLNGIIESQRGEINRALARDEQLRRDQQLLHEQLLEQNRELCEAQMKNLNEMEELKRFQGSTFDTVAWRRLVEDQGHYPWTHSQYSGTTEWSWLSEWFESSFWCWISTQWTIPRSQSISVFPTSSKSWRNAKPFCGNAEPKR